MYQKPTVPRPIGGVLDDTFQLYKAAFSSCWVAVLISSLASIALGIYKVNSMTGVAEGAGFQALLAQYASTTPGYQVASILVGIFQYLITGMLVVIITAVSNGQTPSFGSSLNVAWRRFLPLIGAGIIAGLAAGLGFVLLIIPGIYVLNRMQLFIVPVLTESMGPGESVATSWRLVGGHWWRTASLVFVMIVMVYIVGLVLVAIVGGLAVAIAGVPATVAQGVGKFAVVGLVSAGIVSIFTKPLMVAVLVTIYQDLLLRKGGGDLQARLGALPQG